MAGNRIFTDEELVQLGKSNIELTIEAINVQDKEAAKKAIDAISTAYELEQSGSMAWSYALMDYIKEHRGAETALEITKEIMALHPTIYANPVQQSPLYTKDLLDKMDRKPYDLAIEYVDAGDWENAMLWATILYRTHMANHDRMQLWKTAFMTYIYREMSPQDLYDAMKTAVSNYYIPFCNEARDADARSRILVTIDSLRCHLEPQHVEEDDVKVTTWMMPCGSGQKMHCQGVYEGAHGARVNDMDSLTWGIPDFPIYCVHSPLQELVAIEQLGYPLSVTNPHNEIAKDPNWKMGCQSCAWELYKDVRDTPEYVYTAHGKEKPKF